MDFIGTVARRWLITGIGLGIVAMTCWVVLDRVGTDYQASGQVVFLLPPEVSGPALPTNPYINLQPELSTMAVLVAGGLTTPDARAELTRSGDVAHYDVALTPGTGPMLVITTKDKDPEVALDTRDAVMALAEVELSRMQASVAAPERQQITLRTSNLSTRAEVLPGSRLRAVAGTGGAGLLMLLVGVFAVDRALALRATTRPDVAEGTRGMGHHVEDDFAFDHPTPSPGPWTDNEDLQDSSRWRSPGQVDTPVEVAR